MIYNPFDVVVVPFPFTDRKSAKRRPALILSDKDRFNTPSGHYVMSMITSQKNPDWPLDVPIAGKRESGLVAPSKVRMKLFTLDGRLVLKKIGRLSDPDRENVVRSLKHLLAEAPDPE